MFVLQNMNSSRIRVCSRNIQLKVWGPHHLFWPLMTPFSLQLDLSSDIGLQQRVRLSNLQCNQIVSNHGHNMTDNSSSCLMDLFKC